MTAMKWCPPQHTTDDTCLIKVDAEMVWRLLWTRREQKVWSFVDGLSETEVIAMGNKFGILSKQQTPFVVSSPHLCVSICMNLRS